MPTYDYLCPKCSRRQERFLKLVDLDQVVVRCPHCFAAMDRLISKPMVRGDYEAYNCPITGKLVEGKRAHIENLKRNGCRVLEPGETREAMKRAKADKEAATAAAVEKAIEGAARDLGFSD